MNPTRTWTRRLLAGAAVTTAIFAMAACCKDKKDEEEGTLIPTTENVPGEVNAAPTTPDPEWKAKCPEADRAESGMITVTRQLNIYRSPAASSERKSSLSPDTWANLLGASGTWYCIDYPCGVGTLCPGWIEAQYATRTRTHATATPDAGAPAATATATTTATAAPPTDAGTGTTAVTDAAAATDARFRLPVGRLRDAGLITGAGGGTGTGTATGTGGAPGGRPPLPIKPQ